MRHLSPAVILRRFWRFVPADWRKNSVSEVAALTGWNATVVKVRAFRASKKMRQALEASEESSD
jgi:DNA-directed RNA polymerase specialized sigma24 family protein